MTIQQIRWNMIFQSFFLNEKMKEILIYDFYIFHEICLPAYN